MTTTLNNHKLTVKDFQPIRCVLEMGEDSDISVFIKPGSLVSDVHYVAAVGAVPWTFRAPDLCG